MLNKLRPFIAKYINLLSQNIDVNPNIITVIGLILSFFAVLLSATRKYVGAVPFLIALSGIADVLDGAIARVKNRVTAWGGVLDSFCDRIEEFNYLFSLTLLGVNSYLGYLAILVSFLISYLRALGEERGIRVEGVGILERGERIVLIFIAALVIVINGGYGASVADMIVLALVMLGAVTVVQRLYYILKELRRS
jgi:Phosphatidylglycerophosphate synthase|uniref:CDP-alcohol phosphatidyltransferase family protein n=1 Tax=Ignisphaera aggregans TaxID=334771 RepID=A0A7J3Z6T7_9CREN